MIKSDKIFVKSRILLDFLTLFMRPSINYSILGLFAELLVDGRIAGWQRQDLVE
jgi:hypothetical protein